MAELADSSPYRCLLSHYLDCFLPQSPGDEQAKPIFGSLFLSALRDYWLCQHGPLLEETVWMNMAPADRGAAAVGA
ncbi:MAG: hypothetical protein ACK4ZJ_18830, partial [Allorhizobium sp.]